MDPYRDPGEAPPPPEEPARLEEPEEEPGMFFMRRFRRKWITLTILAWVLATPLLIPGLFYALWGWADGSVKGIAVALVAEGIQALVYLSPLWAWGVARDELRRESWGIDLGGWIVSGALPRWFLWMVPASIPISAVAFLAGGIGGFFAARIVYLVVWLALCVTMMGQVGLLRWTQAGDGKGAPELEDGRCRRAVALESVDAGAERVRFVDDRQSMSWRVVSPLGKLERDVKELTARKT